MSAKHDKVKQKYETWVLGSIKQTYEATKRLEGGSTPLAAFILVSCAIDFLAGFMCGINSFEAGQSSKNYKAFITKYLPQYDPDDIYVKIRCRLAHNYTIGPDMALTHLQPEIHDPRGKLGYKIINFENLFDDFQKAGGAYFKDLSSDPQLQEAFSKRLVLGYADSPTSEGTSL